jgi:hypothetical protein
VIENTVPSTLGEQEHFEDPPMPIASFHVELEGLFVDNGGDVTAFMWPGAYNHSQGPTSTLQTVDESIIRD